MCPLYGENERKDDRTSLMTRFHEISDCDIALHWTDWDSHKHKYFAFQGEIKKKGAESALFVLQK